MPAIPSQSNSRRVSLAELFFPESMVSRPEAEEVRAGSAKELGTAEGKGGKQRGLDRSRLLVIGLLAVANFFATVSFSCIVPFFPTEAIQQKEQSTTQVGLVIGWFQLIQFLASPVIGKNMALLRPNRAFSGGILLSGISAIIFGLANWLPPGNAFFVGTLLVRTAQAVGSAAFATGTFSLVGRFFPNQIGLITAINEVAYGLGFTLGPPLGSVLFEAGGYLLPCLVVGSAQVALVFLSLPLHWGPLAQSDLDQAPAEAAAEEAAGKLPAPGIFQLLCIPDVFMPMLSLFVLCIAWVFYEPDLAHHLSSFAGHWSPSMMVGLMMTLHSSAYLITAPIWGYLLDRHFGQRTTAVILIGGSLTLLYALLVGPSPLLPLPKSLPLFGFSFTLIGISGAILYIPVFKWCVEAAKEHGFDEKSPAVCGLVSGFFQSTVSLGAFLGTTLGGWSSEKFGFAWTATGVAALELFQMTLQVLYYFVKKRRQNRSNKVRNMEAQKEDHHNHNVWK